MRKLLMLMLAPCLSGVAVAEEVVDAERLASLEGAESWPVVDVRDLVDRSRVAIPGALEFDAQLSLSGPVLVVGSEDSMARLSAVALESRFEGVDAYAVAGGIDSLRAIRSDLPQAPQAGAMPGTFTIPSDTCQAGEPLHTFSDENNAETK